MTVNKWDKRFCDLAKTAAEWSKDPNKQVGAVVVSPSRRKFSFGYNGFPYRLTDDMRLNDRETKNSITVHAEVNAILNAEASVVNWTLYCSAPVCLSCALLIIQSGIKRVVMPEPQPSSNWSQSTAQALELFREAGVTVTTLKENEHYV